MTSAPPKVFISYSHDSAEHQARVLSLADRLRADGVDAEVDQYNTAPPEGWPLWCERQIETADFVLMVCTESYHRRVKGDESPGTGLGVVWEAGIIRQLLYDARCGRGQRQVHPGSFLRRPGRARCRRGSGWNWRVA